MSKAAPAAHTQNKACLSRIEKAEMVLLTVPCRRITLIEFVSRRSLAASEEKTLSGVVPGNPKMSPTVYHLDLAKSKFIDSS